MNFFYVYRHLLLSAIFRKTQGRDCGVSVLAYWGDGISSVCTLVSDGALASDTNYSARLPAYRMQNISPRGR